MGAERLTVELRNDPAEVERLHDAVDQFGARHGLPDEVSWAAALCLEELLTNVIKYAYPDAGEHRIRVRLERAGRELAIEVRDDGRPFDPLARPAPDVTQRVEERPIGGLGIHLVRHLMTEVGYRRDQGWNVISLRKRWEPGAGGG